MIADDPAITALLLSIDELHARRIFAGQKEYELRKVLPSRSFQRVFLMQTGGVGLVGCFDVGQLLRDSPERIWSVVGERATPEDRFFRYFAGRRSGNAIGILRPQEFSKPYPVAPLRGLVPKLKSPQSFVTTHSDDVLFKLLERIRRAEMAQDQHGVSLRPIEAPQRAQYLELVQRHIAANYDDIDSSFGESILACHDASGEVAAFFTTGKVVYAAYNRLDQHVGYTTLTLKSGMCAKSGPTILLQEYVGQGLGLGIRASLECEALRLGVRKLYCTAPAVSKQVVGYLLRAGYRVEAHLRSHYTPRHDELVFGRVLIDVQPPPLRLVNVVNAGSCMLQERKLSIPQVRAVLTHSWFPLNVEVADRIAKQVTSEGSREFRFKPKCFVALMNGTKVVAGAVLVAKRGGSLKVMLAGGRMSGAVLRRLLKCVDSEARRRSARKLYILHPLLDHLTLSTLLESGYRLEGTLVEPYIPRQHVVVLGRLLE